MKNEKYFNDNISRQEVVEQLRTKIHNTVDSFINLTQSTTEMIESTASIIDFFQKLNNKKNEEKKLKVIDINCKKNDDSIDDK